MKNGPTPTTAERLVALLCAALTVAAAVGLAWLAMDLCSR